MFIADAIVRRFLTADEATMENLSSTVACNKELGSEDHILLSACKTLVNTIRSTPFPPPVEGSDKAFMERMSALNTYHEESQSGAETFVVAAKVTLVATVMAALTLPFCCSRRRAKSD